jgi:hypothetical protein
MCYKDIETSALASFFQLKMLFCCTEKDLDISASSIDTNYFIIRKIFIRTQQCRPIFLASVADGNQFGHAQQNQDGKVGPGSSPCSESVTE